MQQQRVFARCHLPCATLSFTPVLSPSASRDLWEALDRLLADGRKSGDPGLVVGVDRGSETLYRGAFGLASVEHRLPLTPETRLRIGSVSKHFACVLAIRAEQQGILSLDDPVSKHLPEAGGRWGDRLLLRHLCNNTGGVPDFLELLHLSGAGLLPPITSAECVELILAQPSLNSEPGTRLIYTAGGFLILSLLLERVTEQGMGDLLRAWLFEPVGMTDTALVSSDAEIVPDMATPYVPDSRGGLKRGGWGLELSCEGGIISTLADMQRWGRWLLSDTLGRSALERMRVPARYANGRIGIYGLGLAVPPVWRSRVVGHGGRTPGFRTEFLLVPAEELVVTIIANDGRIDTAALGDAALDRLFRSLPGLRRRAMPMPSDWAARTGGYADANHAVYLELAIDDGAPTVVTSSARYALFPDGVGGQSFRPSSTVWDAVLEFGDDPDKIDVVDSGIRHTLVRCPPDPAIPGDVFGPYFNAALGTTYTLSPGLAHAQLRIQGPRGFKDYAVEACAPDLLVASPVGPFASCHHPRIRVMRDDFERITGLSVSTERTFDLVFQAVGGAHRTAHPADSAASSGMEMVVG